VAYRHLLCGPITWTCSIESESDLHQLPIDSLDMALAPSLLGIAEYFYLLTLGELCLAFPQIFVVQGQHFGGALLACSRKLERHGDHAAIHDLNISWAPSLVRVAEDLRRVANSKVAARLGGSLAGGRPSGFQLRCAILAWGGRRRC
jgi:hypothetical protein